MTHHALERALDRIELTSSLPELETALIAVRSDFGLANVVYHAVTIPAQDSANPILLLTYDKHWVRLYHERDYFRLDPVVRAGVRGFLPLDWSNVDRASLEAQAFFRKAEAHGVGRQGLTLPVRGPAGERALFTVTSNLAAAEWQAQRLDRMRDFQILAHFVHDRAVTLAGYRPRQALLSARELQCLAQVAAGRHVKQVASDLGLSGSAVNLYLRSVRNKLKSANLAEAVVKATRLELLSCMVFYSDLFDFLGLA